MLWQCTESANETKVITRHMWLDSKERMDQHRLSKVREQSLLCAACENIKKIALIVAKGTKTAFFTFDTPSKVLSKALLRALRRSLSVSSEKSPVRISLTLP